MHSWEFFRIPRNSQKTGNSVCKSYLHNWEFSRIPRNRYSQKTGNLVHKGCSLNQDHHLKYHLFSVGFSLFFCLLSFAFWCSKLWLFYKMSEFYSSFSNWDTQFGPFKGICSCTQKLGLKWGCLIERNADGGFFPFYFHCFSQLNVVVSVLPFKSWRVAWGLHAS